MANSQNELRQQWEDGIRAQWPNTPDQFSHFLPMSSSEYFQMFSQGIEADVWHWALLHYLFSLRCLFSFPSPASFMHPLLSSVAQLCSTLCDPMDCSTPGFPAHHQLPELAQTHVQRVGDAIQPSHPLSSPSPPPITLSQHQGFFNKSVLPMRWPKYWSFSFNLPMNIQDWSPLGWTGWISLLCRGLSRVFSNTTVQKHQFFGAQLSLYSNSLIHTWPLE